MLKEKQVEENSDKEKLLQFYDSLSDDQRVYLMELIETLDCMIKRNMMLVHKENQDKQQE